MSIHPMPKAGDPKQIARLVCEPKFIKSKLWPAAERMMWTCQVYSTIFEGAVHTTGPAFTAGGAAQMAEIWMKQNGYMFPSRIGRDTITTLG